MLRYISNLENVTNREARPRVSKVNFMDNSNDLIANVLALEAKAGVIELLDLIDHVSTEI